LQPVNVGEGGRKKKKNGEGRGSFLSSPMERRSEKVGSHGAEMWWGRLMLSRKEEKNQEGANLHRATTQGELAARMTNPGKAPGVLAPPLSDPNRLQVLKKVLKTTESSWAQDTPKRHSSPKPPQVYVELYLAQENRPKKCETRQEGKINLFGAARGKKGNVRFALYIEMEREGRARGPKISVVGEVPAKKHIIGETAAPGPCRQEANILAGGGKPGKNCQVEKPFAPHSGVGRGREGKCIESSRHARNLV